MNFPTENHLDVRSLAKHWMMRCVENGIPLDDYLTTTNRMSSWDDWCREWEETGDERSRQADEAEAASELLTAAELRLVAALEYHFGKFLFLHDHDAFRAVHRKAVVSYNQAMSHLPWPGRRFDIKYSGTSLPAVLRLPRPEEDGPFPAVVVVPGLDATKEEMHRFQEPFLARGLATITLDGPGQGESEYAMALRSDWEAVGACVLDSVGELAGVDAARLAMVGVSLGGYFAARTACADSRLRATAIVGGCYSVGECWDNLPFLTREAFRFRSGASSEGAARLAADQFSLSDCTHETSAPVLVVHGEKDRLFGPDQAVRLAQHFEDRSELVLEPEGNHVLHNLAYRIRPLIADWVARALNTEVRALAPMVAATPNGSRTKGSSRA